MYDISSDNICYMRKDSGRNYRESAAKGYGLVHRAHFPGDDRGSFDKLFSQWAP